MHEKPKKIDPASFAPLLANKGFIIVVGGVAILFSKVILSAGVAALIGHLTGKVVKRFELRRKAI
jgi:hypothetical protein